MGQPLTHLFNTLAGDLTAANTVDLSREGVYQRQVISKLVSDSKAHRGGALTPGETIEGDTWEWGGRGAPHRGVGEASSRDTWTKMWRK